VNYKYHVNGDHTKTSKEEINPHPVSVFECHLSSARTWNIWVFETLWRIRTYPTKITYLVMKGNGEHFT
jgi:hypothetical protein